MENRVYRVQRFLGPYFDDRNFALNLKRNIFAALLCSRLMPPASDGIPKDSKGRVAQLNSASDYGSEGSRFESWRGHDTHKTTPLRAWFFILWKNQTAFAF